MKPTAFVDVHSAPVEATLTKTPIGRRRRAQTLLVVTGFGITAVASASCTVTSEGFSPAPLVADREPSAASEGEPDGVGDLAAVDVPTPVEALPGVEGGEGNPAAVPLEESDSTGAGSGDTGAAVAEGDAPSAAQGPPDAGRAAPANLPLPELSSLVGWASMPGLGIDTTTGGGDAPPVVVRTAEELVALAARPEPLTIAIEGTIEVAALTLASNKTLLGVDGEATLRGGIAVRGTPDAFVTNVIVANLSIAAETSAVDGDGIQVHYAHHVWVDHCALRDAADGLLDIVHGSDFVTVSNTRFFYTPAAPDSQHRFAALVGHDVANAAEDRGHLNVTWHHDFWGEGALQAMSGRFGSIHVFNNLFRSPGGDGVLAAGLESRWLVENNLFEGVAAPHTILLGGGASLAASGNVYILTSGARDATATGFVPAYPYALESPLELAATIEAEAGPH
jgi:pectate lyase